MEIRIARIGAGLSLRDVAAAAGVDHAVLWRFERRRQDLSLSCLSAACAVLGLDLAIRAYPAGDPIRDAAHARLLARLRRRLHPRLRWSTEVPLPGAAELRAWDAVIRGADWEVAVEAETVLHDVQALERRLALKIRDGGDRHLVLLVADTSRNRRAFAAAPAAFATLPLRNREVLGSLRLAQAPAQSGIVMI
jgi:transcriptional regulator with XRE-family HTH domain